MNYNDILTDLRGILAEIFECQVESLTAETRIFQDLPCESIDLLEIAARISRRFHIQTDDDAMFLRSLRTQLEEVDTDAKKTDIIARKYPWLSPERITKLIQALTSPQPTLNLGDIASYVFWELNTKASV